MARVPVINGPCPLRMNSSPQPGQDFCGQCRRQVHNLDLLSANEREAFLSDCSEKVCVSYTLRRPLRASFALGVGLVAAASLAGEATPPAPDELQDEDMELVIVTGGTVVRDELQWVDESEAATPDKADLPEIAAVAWLPTPKP